MLLYWQLDDHVVDNHLSDKFISLSHVCYFINDAGRKLTIVYICHIFYIFETKFYIFIFQEWFVSELQI